MTDRQKEAIAWMKANYGRKWKQRLQWRPEELPLHYRGFWYKPFGIKEWNDHMRIARRLLWQGKI